MRRGHAAWPNTSYVINALAYSMRGVVAGSTRLRIVRRSSSGSFPTFAAIRRVSSLESNLAATCRPRLVLERPSLTVPAGISTCAVLLSI